MINSFAALLTCFTFTWIAPPHVQSPPSPVATSAPPATSDQTDATPPLTSGEGAPIKPEEVAFQLLSRFKTITYRYQEAMDLFGPLVDQIHKVARPVFCAEEYNILHSAFSATRGANNDAAAASMAAYAQLVLYQPQDQSVAPTTDVDLYERQVTQMMGHVLQTESAYQVFAKCMSRPVQMKRM